MKNRNLLLTFHALLWLAIPSTSTVPSHGKPNAAIEHREQNPDPFYSNIPLLPPPLHHDGYYMPYSKIFNIISFGAVGDGVSDDSKALKAAWKASCMFPRATIEIPSRFKFLIRPITLQGPCRPHLVLQIDGTLLAPSSMAQASIFQWVNLKWLNDFTIQGSGTVDGQGSVLWNVSRRQNMQSETKHTSSKMRPTVIRFYKSYNITVRGIQIINSPQCHLKFDNSQDIIVKNITISSPMDSTNTDGIHLENTRNVEIKHSIIGCGDDCVSIQTGCSNINIHHINCSPGHGISVGGLGKGNTLACVSNVSISRVTVQNALSGVRIKTWQGGLGSVRNVTFSNVRVANVEIPIMIDQYYCDKRLCKNKTDAVAISDVMFKGIKGTYLYQPMHIACSDTTPCTDVNLMDVQLSPVNKSQIPREAFCWKSYGESQGILQPTSVCCLQRVSSRLLKILTKSHNFTCY